MVWLEVVTACIAVAGAGIAVWQAKSAAGSRQDAQLAQAASEDASAEALRLAQEANTARERHAAAAEFANEIAAASIPPETAPWGAATATSGDGFEIRNESARAAVIEGVEADPTTKANLLHLQRVLPATLDPGDSFPFMSSARASLSRPSVVITWRWDGETVTATTRREVS